MSEKKACKMDDEALQRVSGGKDEKKYRVGDMVEFEGFVCGSMFNIIPSKLVGKITEINGSTYTIKVGTDVYYVNEEDIKCLANVDVEGGVHGGW